MGFRYEIRLSGAGGQGLILIGKILAEAAAIYDNKNAIQSQSYGPEAHSEASRSEVIISDEDIESPKVNKIDFLLAMTQEAVDKYANAVKPGGIILVDSGYVENVPNGKYSIYSLAITKFAEEKMGKRVVANILALGAIERLTNIISEDALLNAIRARVPKGTEETNILAFKHGQSLIKV
jgi:2-oxoglutarate ferredoxin oxidoreductase subunit gamma